MELLFDGFALFSYPSLQVVRRVPGREGYKGGNGYSPFSFMLCMGRLL